MHAEGSAEGAGSWARAGTALTGVAQQGAFARRLSVAYVGSPAAAALRDARVQTGTRLEEPTCPGQPLPRGRRACRVLGERACGLFKGLSRGGFGSAGLRRTAG